jgi:transposase InsO family protein
MGYMLGFIEKSTMEQDGDTESLHGSLKKEYISVNVIEDFLQYEKNIEYAFLVYNNVKPHSLVEYLPAALFKERL